MFLKSSVFVVALSLAVGVLPHAAFAQEAKKSTDFPVLEKLKGDDKELEYDYLGKKYGLDAWLLSGPSLMQIVYIIPNEKTAIVGGTLVNPDGKEASSTLLQEFLKANPDRAATILEYVRSDAVAQQKDAVQDKAVVAQSPSEKFWRDLSSVGAITFGANENSPEIYAVLDPAQAETKIVWSVLSALAEKGHLRVHVVPLAATTADSIMDVASVLGDKDANTAWINLMDGQKPETAKTPETHGVLRMKAIVDLAQAMNLRQLPLLVYRVGEKQEKSGAVRIVRGVPKNWVTVFKEAGMAEQATPKAE